MPNETRHRARLLVRLSVFFLAVVLSAIGASGPVLADPIADKKAEAAALAARIDAANRRVDVLAERFNAAQLRVQQTDAQLAKLTADYAAADAAASKSQALLKAAAVNSYVRGGMSTVGSLLEQQPGQLAVANAYVRVAAGDQAEARDAARVARDDLKVRRAQLDATRQDATAALDAANKARSDAAKAVAAQQADLAKVKGELASLVAAEQQRQAEAIAARNRAAAASRAAATRTAVATASPLVSTAPAPSSRAGAAVAEAQRQLGKPYQWGAAGPDSFDCSGLTMWAWAAAGVSLPHYTGAQYSATTHIPLSDLQPGDLVFFYSGLSHVGLYVGNGMMIHAPHTGDVVRYASIYSEGSPIYAGRVNA